MAVDSPTPAPINEEKSIRLAQEGDVAAFNQLVLSYQGLAYSVAYRILQNRDTTSDAVQDSFVKAYRALASFHGGSFKSWLMRIVVNTCYDMLRAQRRRAAESLDDEDLHQEHSSRLIDNSERPEQYAERMELNGWLEEAISSLPDDQRIVIVLCDIHGYAYDEIAEIVALPIGTVKSRISRGRARLRDALLARPELLPGTFRPKHKQ